MNPEIKQNINTNTLWQLSTQLHESSIELQKLSSTPLGKFVIWLSKKLGKMPARFVKHIEMHTQLESAIKQISMKNREIILPSNIARVIDESTTVVNDIFHLNLRPFADIRSEIKSNIAAKNTKIYQMNRKEIEDAVRSLNITDKELPRNLINKAFQREVNAGNTFQVDLEKMISDLGLDIKVIPPEDIKALTALFLVARQINAPVLAQKISLLVSDKLFPFVLAHFKTAENYETEAELSKRELLQKFGIPEEEIPQTDQILRDLIFVKSKITDRNSIFFQGLIHKIDGFASESFRKISVHLHNLDQNNINREDLEKNVTSAMAILHYLAEGLPLTMNTERIWVRLEAMYEEILRLKTTRNQTVRNVVEGVFQQYQSFLEDGLFTYLLYKRGGSIEDKTQAMYGRTAKEVESIKNMNRNAVAGKIKELAKKVTEEGEPLTIEMLTELHRTNNQGIVPKFVSEFRKGRIPVIFGKRTGVYARDIERVMADVIQRANAMLTRRTDKNPIANLRWATEIAQLHNEILDIHPFPDRNGSTALLFLELMMAIKGDYEPAPKRNAKYYETLSNILRNPIGVAIVAYEHFKIAHVSGQYEK